MTHEWLPQTPSELRRQSSKLERLALHVQRPDVAQRLREHSAKLLAEAELKAIAARKDAKWLARSELGTQLSRSYDRIEASHDLLRNTVRFLPPN